MIRYFLLYITTVCACLHTCGQQVPNFIFKHLSVNDGLASNNVYCTLQDAKGLWWIGTDNGLQRWDGYRFIEYHSDPTNPNSLLNDVIIRMMEDKQGNIWLAHFDGLTIYNKTKNLFTRIPIDTSEKQSSFAPAFNTLFQDGAGTIWIAGNNIGLQCYNQTSKRFERYTKKLPPFHMRFYFIEQQASTGNYWMGTDSGLVCYNIKDHQYYYRGNNPKHLRVFDAPPLRYPFTCFYIDKNENLWLCNWPTFNAVYHPMYYSYSISGDSITYYPKASLNEPHSVVEDPFGRVWLGGGSLHYFDKATLKFITVPKQELSKVGMDYDELTQVYCDKDRNIWLATDNGLFIFKPGPKPINTYLTDTSIIKERDPNMAVTGFLAYDANNIWVTTWGRGAFLYDSAFHLKKRIFGNTPTRNLFMAWCVTRGKNNHLWFGWQNGIVLEYDPVNNTETYFEPVELKKKTVRQVVCDSSGNIWMGTQRGILAMYDPVLKHFEIIFDGNANGYENGNVLSMKIDGKQHLWVGTSSNGLLEVDMVSKKLIRHFSNNKSGFNDLKSTGVGDMCFINDSTLLLTGSGGVELLNSNSGKVFLFEYPALRTNNIKSVEKGLNGNVYLAGPNGIYRINLPQMKLHIYGEQDGLLFNVFAEGAHTLLKDGRICFGTNRNFITINETGEKDFTSRPQALVSGIRIMNQPLSIDSLESLQSPVELTYDRNYVAIDFASPATLLQPNNTFLYKMEGFDRDWKIAAQYPSAEYSNLPPGRYKFLLKYRNTDGEESNEGAIIPFIIHPPFYLRWWFIVIATGLVAAIIYLLHRIRVNKLLTMEKVRIHIARDLHDDMGSTLSSINILSVMSRKTIDKEPARTRDYLDRISENSQRMMDSMDDIVWSINPLNDNIERIVARMREVAATILEPKEIGYKFRVDDAVNHLKMDMSKRRDLFLIFKEAINNMAKYSDCTNAVIHITAKKNRFIMHIEDNGCGFNETVIEEGNGLLNMRKRAEGLKGRLLINSRPGEGTELTLNIPV